MTADRKMFRIRLERPSRSKCPNAWVALGAPPNWVHDETTVPAGTRLVIGGNLRRATRTERVREELVVDEPGSYGAWDNFGTIVVGEA